MGSKVYSNLVLVNVVISLVSGYVHFETPTQAIDHSLYEQVLDETQCAEQINIIRSTPLLTITFADAGIRIPSGVTEGNLLDMGNYHQCINIKHPLEQQDSELQGKYCVIRVPMNQNFECPVLLDLPVLPENLKINSDALHIDNETIKSLEEYSVMRKAMKAHTGIAVYERVAAGSPFSGLQLTLAVCIPKPCTTRQAFDSFLFNISAAGFEYSDVYCRLPNDKPWAPADYVAIVLFSLLGIITLVSTSYDLWHTFIKKTDPKKLSVIGKSFSVYTNGRRLMTFSSSPDSVECIDGIRALAMAWVVLGHAFTTEVTFSNPLDAVAWSRSWEYLWVGGAHYTVDTFFTLSGFLVVYTTVGKLSAKTLLKNIHLFYLNRLLRMFPLLAAAVLLEASYLNRTTDGPDWTVVATQVNNCRATWWSTLLHIQNYMNPALICIVQTWYLAIDVQLHILCPIILVWVLWGNKKIAWIALLTGFLGVLTASTIYIFINKFPPVMVAAGRENEIQKYVNFYYINTLTRAPPFFVGMIFGYLARVARRRITGLSVIIFWAVFFTVTTYLMYFNLPITQPTWDNQFMSSFYNAFFRTFWAIAVGSLIYACMNGFAGPINRLLSQQVWKIHARLSYAIFLYHYMLLVAVNHTATAPVFFTPGSMTFKFLAHYSFTMTVAFVMTLVVDAPFSTLFKLVLGVKKPIKKEEDDLTARANINGKRA